MSPEWVSCLGQESCRSEVVFLFPPIGLRGISIGHITAAVHFALLINVVSVRFPVERSSPHN